MGNFNRDSRDSRRPSGGFNRGFDRNKSFGGNRRPGGRDRDGARPTMHQAVCSECGQDCEIPFKPSNGRPIFCSKCFEKQSGGSSRPSSFGGERRDSFGFDDKQMHQAVCDKCGKTCQVPFKPSSGKPVFCDNCFGKGGNDNFSKGPRDTKDSGEVMQEIKMLNTKMDQLIKLLTPNTPSEKIVKATKPENKTEKKSEVKAEDKPVVKEKAKAKVVAKKAPAKKKK